MIGDEFEQYKRAASAANAVPGDDEDQEFEQYRRKQEAKYGDKVHYAHGSPEEAAQLQAMHADTGVKPPDFSTSLLTPPISGRMVLNAITDPQNLGYELRTRGTRPSSTPALFPDVNVSPERDPYQHLLDYSNSSTSHPDWLTRKTGLDLRRGGAHAITDSADMGASQATLPNLVLGGMGALTKVAPAAGIITKPIFAGTSAAYGIAGASDAYDALKDHPGDEHASFLDKIGDPERLQKALLGGSAVAGGAAGIGESSLRGTFNKNMDIARPNEPFTLRELMQGARDHGVNLDLADASGAGLPRTAKKYVSRSLGGANTFDTAQKGNVAALDQWGSDYLNKLSPYSGENAGARIQDALKNDYAQRKGSASQEFEDLDKRVGPNTIDGTQTVEAEAVKIRDGMKDYYEKHPELVPKEAWRIINDLAERPTVNSTKTVTGPGFGQPANKVQVQVPAKSNNFSWSELHQLRSDLMDIYRNNPDLVKSRADSWLQQMVKTIDDTMTGAASQLSPADKWQFRAANETWEGLKQTYDNPAHPLYHAVRAQQPSQVTNMLLNMKAPEFARQMKGVLGPEYGDLQRAAAERILGQDRTGAGYDFKSMPGRLKNYPPAYINDLLGPAARDLRMLSRTGMTVFSNENPSGTGGVVIPASEAGTIAGAALTGHPAALLVPPTEYGMARAMNSPRVVDYLTDPRSARAMPRGLPVAAGATTMNDRDQNLARRILRRPAEIAGP